MEAARTLASIVNWTQACLALGVARASAYRFWNRKENPVQPKEPVKPERALSDAERKHVLEVLNSDKFVDIAPQEVYATLLDEGIYLCSMRTMYRILEENKEVRERRNQAKHAEYAKPELLATRPNELWSWDITKLKGAVKWSYFHLYVIIDVFSRYVVGWMIADRRVFRACQEADIGDDQQAGSRSIASHDPRGSRFIDEIKTCGADAQRSRRDQNAQPSARLKRQSVLGKPVQDDEVSPRVPRKIRLVPGCKGIWR